MSNSNSTGAPTTTITATSTSTSTAALMSSLAGRKHKAKMGADLNESVATGPSAFAKKQLEKMGWTEGTGLGKNRDGRATHIRVKKRETGQALGSSSAANLDPVVTGDQWWKSSVGNTLARLKAKSDKKKKKTKKNKDKDSKKSKSNRKRKLEYTDEELFEATGGARFGMRAQTRQTGKWNRAEQAITKDQEDTAIANTEWDGMVAPKVLLSSSDKDKNETSQSDDDDDDENASEKPRKKRRRTASTSGEVGEDTAAEDDAKKKSKKEKKKKKDKKEKKKKAKKKPS